MSSKQLDAALDRFYAILARLGDAVGGPRVLGQDVLERRVDCMIAPTDRDMA